MAQTLTQWMRSCVVAHQYVPAKAVPNSLRRRRETDVRTGWQLSDLAYVSGVTRHALARVFQQASWKVGQLVRVLDACEFELHIHHPKSLGRWRVDAVPDTEPVVTLVEHNETQLSMPASNDEETIRAQVDVLLCCAKARMQPLRLQAVVRELGITHRGLSQHPSVSGLDVLTLIRARAFADIQPAAVAN